jgi:hypothetical protein
MLTARDPHVLRVSFRFCSERYNKTSLQPAPRGRPVVVEGKREGFQAEVERAMQTSVRVPASDKEDCSGRIGLMPASVIEL